MPTRNSLWATGAGVLGGAVLLVLLVAAPASGYNLLSYYPVQGISDDAELEHFHLRGYSVKLDESCGEWCSDDMVLGVPQPAGAFLKTLDVEPREGCERSFMELKGRRAWELYCVIGDRVFLTAEKGPSLSSRQVFRQFRYEPGVVTGTHQNEGYVWIKKRARSGFPGEMFLNWFNEDWYASCAADSSTARPWTLPVFYGPYNLRKPAHRAGLATLLDDNQWAVEALAGLAEQMDKPALTVRVVARVEYLPGGSLEVYLLAKVGRFGVGRVGWGKAVTSGEPSSPATMQRLSIWSVVVPEGQDRRVPNPHCSL